MTVEFQNALMQYLFQHKEAKVYAKYLDESIFDNPFTVIIFKQWKDYVKQYSHIPSKANAIEAFEVDWADVKSANKSEKVKKELTNLLYRCYEPLDSDTVFIQDRIINFAQKKLTRKLLTKAADKIPNASSKLFDNMAKQMNKIAGLKEHAKSYSSDKGHFYIKQPEVDIKRDHIRILPSPFIALNKMTAVGGFHAPQLIVILKGPKAFGTGILLTMAANDLKRGEKVYYADTENGLLDIYTRLDMALLNCEYHELGKYKKELASIKSQIAKRGGEFKSDYYEGGVATLEELDDNLQGYADEGTSFTSCYNDYIDNFEPKDRYIKETRLKTKATYKEQIAINKKYGFPCITISTVNALAFNKAVITAQDMGEDKSKAYNCHASFALCATDEEVKAGTIRLIPVVQRMGTQFMFNARTTCALKLDQKKMEVKELNAEGYLEAMPDLYAKVDSAPKHRMIKLPKTTLKDE